MLVITLLAAWQNKAGVLSATAVHSARSIAERNTGAGSASHPQKAKAHRHTEIIFHAE